MKMECELPISSFKGPRMVELVNEHIGLIVGGSSPHAFKALKPVFKKAFDLKRQPPGVVLRCSWTGCTSHNNHVSISSVGINVIYCKKRDYQGYNRYLACVA